MIPILDNGHGGVINGEYQTAGKRSPKWYRGVLYEGMFNRWIVNRTIECLDKLHMPYYHISPELKDISLKKRVDRANDLYTGKEYILSIHANAGGGSGIEGFTTKGHTKSDKIGEIFLTDLETTFPESKMRFDNSDGDKDKEEDFYILRKFTGPAFLLECGFMDSWEDYVNLWNKDYKEKMVNSLMKSIHTVMDL